MGALKGHPIESKKQLERVETYGDSITKTKPKWKDYALQMLKSLYVQKNSSGLMGIPPIPTYPIGMTFKALCFPIGVSIATIKIGNRGESSSTQLPISCVF